MSGRAHRGAGEQVEAEGGRHPAHDEEEQAEQVAARREGVREPEHSAAQDRVGQRDDAAAGGGEAHLRRAR